MGFSGLCRASYKHYGSPKENVMGEKWAGIKVADIKLTVLLLVISTLAIYYLTGGLLVIPMFIMPIVKEEILEN